MRTVIVGLCFLIPVFAADSESALKPEIASSLTRLGLTFIVGTYQQFSDSNKSSVSPEDLALVGDQAKALVDQYQVKVREGAFAANLLYTTLDVAIGAGQVMGSSTVVAAAPTAAVAAIARYGNEKLRDFILDDAVASASAVLSNGIDKMSQRLRCADEEFYQLCRYAAIYELLWQSGL